LKRRKVEHFIYRYIPNSTQAAKQNTIDEMAQIAEIYFLTVIEARSLRSRFFSLFSVSLSFSLFLSLFVILGLELRAFTLSHSTSPIFCDRVFRDRVS
jgi:hypothetical protein